MKKMVLVSVALCAGALASTFLPSISSAKNDKFRRAADPVAGRYIVVLDDNAFDLASGERVGDEVSDLARTYGGRTQRVYANVLKGYATEMPETDAMRLSSDPRVKYVEEDSLVEPQAIQDNSGWGLSRLDQRGWSYPYDNTYSYGSSGRGVSVYILDDKFLTSHPDFGGRAFPAFDAYNDPTPAGNCSYHGTFVAGIVGSQTYGVAKSAALYSVAVLPCSGGAGTTSTVIAGLDWVYRNASRPAVINMSFAANVSATLESAVQNVINAGISAVSSAGNYNADACNYSPGRMADVINVSSTDVRDYQDEYTASGSCVDIFAPGVAVSSTSNYNGGSFGQASGTSFAAPYAAGAAALYLETNPTASARDVAAFIVRQGTPGVIGNLTAGSPNLVLFSYVDGGPTPSPTPVPTPTPSPSPSPAPSCGGMSFGGTLVSGAFEYKSSKTGFSSGSGVFQGTLSVSGGTQILSLERKKGKTWSMVAASGATNSTATVTFSGNSGTYRWKVQSVSGDGSYGLCSVIP